MGPETLLGLVQPFFEAIRAGRRWWQFSRPARKVLSTAALNDRLVRVFVRDFFLADTSPAGTPLLVREGVHGPIGRVPNVSELWPDVEARGIAYLFELFGRINKTQNVDIVRMSQDPGYWDSNIVVMGAQAQKCFDFYKQMEGVAYSIDSSDILDRSSGKPVYREDGYGYGIILKARNPMAKDGNRIGLLVGGFGTLGTLAAARYFSQHAAELGKVFGRQCFGVVVRASITAGEQSVARIADYDKVMDVEA